MYWTVNYFSIAAGRTSEYMAWGRKYRDWLKSQKGFQSRTLLNSYSYPGIYAGAVCWESRDSARSVMTSAEIGAFMVANSVQGIVTFTRPAEAYEDVATVGDAQQAGKCLSTVEWHIDAGKTAAFEQTRHEVFEMRQKLGHGFCFSRLYRLMGNPTRYLGASFYMTRDDAMAVPATPEWQEYFRAHPYTAHGSVRPVSEIYEVIPAE